MARVAIPFRALDGAASQVGQSLVSFLVLLVFVHTLSAGQFGALAAVWLVWTLLMSLHRSVFGEQFIAQGATHASSVGYSDFVYTWTLVGLVCTQAVLLALGQSELLLGASYAVLFAASDAMRYRLMAIGSLRAISLRSSMAAVETVRVILAGLALGLAVAGAAPWIPGALVLVGGGLWLLFSVVREPRLNLGRAAAFVRSKKRFELLVSLQFLLGTALSQAIPFMALAAFGPAAFGSIRLTQSLLAPITLLSTAFQPALIHKYASSTAGSFRRTFSVSLALSLAVGIIMAALAITLIFSAGDLFIPSQQIDAVIPLVIPLSVMVAMVVIGQPGGALIRVLRLGAVSFWGQLVGVAFSLTICFLAVSAGIVPFAWAMALGSMATVAVTYMLLVGTLSRRSPSGGIADRDAI